MSSLAPQLRFFFVLLFGSLLTACSQPVTESAENSETVMCVPPKNIAVCFLEEAEHQGENYGVPPESAPVSKLREAIKDVLTLPLEELRAKRYADSMGEPNKWALHELFSAYFVSASNVMPEDKGFYEALKTPEAVPMLEGWLNGFERRYANLISARDYGVVVCGPSDNIAVCFFSDAIVQGDHSRKPIRDAIKDALTLPLEELRTRRYANYQMKPNQWTFVEALGYNFTGGALMRNGDIVGPRSKGFLEAMKQPEAIPILKKQLADLEESVRQEESED